MFGPSKNANIGVQDAAQSVFWQHSMDGMCKDLSGFPFNEFFWSSETLTSLVPGVTDILLVDHLFSGKANLIGIDDNDIAAGICVRRKIGAMLAAKQHGHFRSKP